MKNFSKICCSESALNCRYHTQHKRCKKLGNDQLCMCKTTICGESSQVSKSNLYCQWPALIDKRGNKFGWKNQTTKTLLVLLPNLQELGCEDSSELTLFFPLDTKLLPPVVSRGLCKSIVPVFF